MIQNQSSELVKLSHVSKVFGQDQRATFAVSDASLLLHRAECVLLLGPSGSGKTTLLTVAAGLTPPTCGSVVLFGKPTTEYRPHEIQRLRSSHVGFVFQAFRLLDPLCVLDNVVIAAEFAGSARTSARQAALGILTELHVDHLAASFPPRLSQGEKQRVATARALVNRPDLIFADEPTASLESSQALLLMKTLLDYTHSNHAGLLVATHDLRLIDYADRVLRIEDGRLSEMTDRAAWPVRVG